jgi:hypothetical protein
MIYCSKCDKHQEVTGFQKDNPILKCGHIKTPAYESNPKIETIVSDINAELAVREVLFTIGYCKKCGTVTYYVDRNGTPICAGDLTKNPGCGMPVEMINA